MRQADLGTEKPSVDAQIRVAQLLLHLGPATAVELADLLEVSPTAVRRHLVALSEQGYITSSQQPPYGPRSPRGRGRPAKIYSLTSEGTALLAPSSDELSLELLAFMSDRLGREAVMDFAKQRLNLLQSKLTTRLAGITDDRERINVLSEVLNESGYVSHVENIDNTQGEEISVQLCQHNCPLADVTTHFSEFCEAETAMFAQVLDTHVTRLATISHGSAVCTTHMPIKARLRSAADRAQAQWGQRKGTGTSA